MKKIYGTPIELDEDKVMESLVLSFSPSLVPLQQRWRNNGLSADFLGDYATTFFPGSDEKPELRLKQSEIKNAISFIANELLENAMKYGDSKSHVPITITLKLKSNSIVFVEKNAINADQKNKMEKFIEKLLATDPQELYFQILEAGGSESGGSGMGLLTMVNDYQVKLTWLFDELPDGTHVATTTVHLDI